MARRLVVPPALLAPGEADLPDDLARYVGKVLRLSAGAELVLHDGAGGVAPAELVAADKRRARVRIGEVARHPRPEPRIELLQAVGKGDKMDAVIRAASELGVSAIHPVLTERAVARQEGRLERWRGIAEDAVRVAGHAHRPALSPVRPLAEALAEVRAETRLVFALEGAESLSRRLDVAPSGVGIALLVGPEGGLTPGEVEAARDAGFWPTHLGPHTLRTETAGAAVAAIAAFWAGRLGA